MSSVKLEWHGDKAMNKLQAFALEMLWLAGQDTITTAMNDIPLDTGTLRRSGTVTVDKLPNAADVYATAQHGSGNRGETTKNAGDAPASSNPLDPKVYVSYNTPYAKRWHEDLTWKPRNWKWSSWKKRKNKEALYRISSTNEKGQVLYREKIPKPAVGGNKWLERALPHIKKRWATYAARARKKVGL